MHYFNNIITAITTTYTVGRAKTAYLATYMVGRAIIAYSTTYSIQSYVYEPLTSFTSEYAEKWGLYEYKTLISESMYNATRNNLGTETANFSSLLVKNFIPSLKDAILLDGIAFYVLGAPVLCPIIGATVAYNLRANINDYFENSKPHGVVGGFIAGAIKYGIAKSTLDWKILLMGSINNALYEWFKTTTKDTVTNNDVVGLYTLFVQIEGVDALFNIMQTYVLYQDKTTFLETMQKDVAYKNMDDAVNIMQKYVLNQLTIPLKVAGLLSVSVWGYLSAKDKAFYSDDTKCYTKDIFAYNITYIDERYKGDYEFTLNRTLSNFKILHDDVLYMASLVANYSKKGEVHIEVKSNHNPKTQCALKNFTQLDISTLDEYYDELPSNSELLNNEETQQDVKEEL